MSIKFFCSCGKRLKAKNDMAARRTVCPVCGNPVGIPSKQPTQRGTVAAPITPMERLTRERKKEAEVGNVAVDCPPTSENIQTLLVHEPALPLSSKLHPEHLDSTPLQKVGISLRVVPRKRRRRWQAWPLETRWHQSLFYPLLAFPLVFGLALLMTILTGALVFFWPNIFEIQAREFNPWWLALIAAPILVIGYSAAFFRCVLASALAGEGGEVRWPGYNLLLVFKSSLALLICFLVGPVVPAVCAYFFWLEGGDPNFADWLILVELNLVAVAHFLYSFLAVSFNDRLRDANPVRVVEMVHQLGRRGAVIVLVGSMFILGIGYMLIDGLQSLNSGPGWLLLFIWWSAGFYVVTLFFRWLGLHCYYKYRLGRHRHPAV